jgi:hypothetical protein
MSSAVAGGSPPKPPQQTKEQKGAAPLGCGVRSREVPAMARQSRSFLKFLISFSLIVKHPHNEEYLKLL